MEDVTLTLYKVSSCGFYSDSGHHFATLDEVFRSFSAWVGGLASIGESSTYAEDVNSDILRAFCMGAREVGDGLFVVSTWNELASVSDGIQILKMDSPIGDPGVTSVSVDALSLPGYPSYFVVDCATEKLLNLRFEQRLNGSRQFQRMMQGFLSVASDWCVKNSDGDIVGYSDDEADDVMVEAGVEAKFSTRLCRVSAEYDYLRGRCLDIRKVVRRASISPVIAEQKVFLDSAFSIAGMPVNNRLRADVNFEYKFKTRLTPEKLEGIILQYEDNSGDDWEDVGFEFARQSGKVHWLSGSAAKKPSSLPVARTDSGMIDFESICSYVESNPGVIREFVGE